MKDEVRSILCFILLTSSFILVAACNFQPVYGTGEGSVSGKLASVKIEKVQGREGQQQTEREGQIIQNTLEGLLNPGNVKVMPAYSIKIMLKDSRREVGINQDLRVTRYDLVPTVDYELVSLDTNKVVDSGQIIIKSSYNRTVSEFATFVAEQNAAELADQELAEELRSRLIYYFSK